MGSLKELVSKFKGTPIVYISIFLQSYKALVPRFRFHHEI